MNIYDLLSSLLPIYAIFLLGIILRRAGVMKPQEATVFLKLVFYVCLPALIAFSISEMQLSRKLLFLPIIPIIIVFLTFVLSLGACQWLKLPPRTRGTFFVGTMVMNIGFIYPIAQGMYGIEGVSHVAIYDIGHGFMAFSVAYFLACWYGGQRGNIKEIIKNVVKSPPLWAIMISIALNLFNIPPAFPVKKTLELVGNGATPLIMLSMGIFFSPKLERVTALFPAIFIRMIAGSLLGFLFTTVFHLEGDMRTITIICSSSPAGHSTLTFSALKNLDIEFAASLVPLSVLFGISYITGLLYVLQ